ncbi:unnamed protein product [[Candida] boidinii]|uniref:Unnamed protein product n=1 Tax=Candida boidinii TaxID=5477 RepID=A0ACB5TSZ5_CANBO|nr:unnamed protein product [[Candida] boidinii]
MTSIELSNIDAHDEQKFEIPLNDNSNGDNINDNSNALSRLSTLSRTLSHLNAKEMENFEIDKNDFDLHKILKFLQRKDDENGLSGKSTNIIFENLTVIAKNTTSSTTKTATELIFSPITSLIKKVSSSSSSNTPSSSSVKKSKTRQIIRNITGFINPGEMVLVLGRPGAGCSTMLKAN